MLTFDFLTRDRNFVGLLRNTLRRLEARYKTPVDIEFTVEILPTVPYPEYRLHLLQCRPLSLRQEGAPAEIPDTIAAADIVFRSFRLIPNGMVEGVRYVVFVDPLQYRQVPDVATKLELGRVVSRLNKRLEGEPFILMGPGRWGSENLELGVRVTYADIYNTSVLIELGIPGDDGVPELSYGTHFFQDLVEGGIYSLPLHLNEEGTVFNWPFFRKSDNALEQLLPADAGVADYLRVIDVEAVTKGRRLTLVMNSERDEAVAYLVQGSWDSNGPTGSVGSF